jgi:hypothetical protein
VTKEDRDALRRAIIAGPTDCPLTPPEAAAFLGIAESTLRESDCPRADIGGTKYLKSQCILYVKLRLSHQLLDVA